MLDPGGTVAAVEIGIGTDAAEGDASSAGKASGA
jgi:hypothetical protein